MDLKAKSTKVNKGKLLILGAAGLVLILTGLLIVIVNPINVIRRIRTRLHYGSDTYKLLEAKKSPGVTVSAYLLNVTNAEEFMSGKQDILKVEEVGPFKYLEERDNEDLDIDDVAQLVRYTPRTTARFLPEDSVADPNDVQVNMPNVAMLVLCTLSFLATGSYQRIVGVTQHLPQRTTSRCIRQVVNALNNNYILNKWIVFPQTQQARSRIRQEFQRIYRMPGVVGCIDCTHIAIVKPDDDEHIFFNRKGYHSLNVQMTMSSMMSEYPFITQLGFNLLLSHLNSKAIVQQTAQEFMWGYDEPLIKLGNTVLPGWISFKTLGIIDRLYDQNVEYRLEVATGNGDRFSIKSMNGIPGLRAWEYEEPSKRTKCNTFEDAYEGIAYPVDFAPGSPIRIFRNVLCRFLPLEYQHSVTMEDGVQGLYYKIRKDAYDITNETECLCTRGTCINGISDLSPCFYKLPLALSNAHFLYGDSSLYKRIEGLHPDEEKHGSEIVIEPKLGMVLKTTFSVQVNVVVKKLDFNSQAARFSEMVVPVCYFKLEQPGLTEQNKHDLKLLYVIAPYALWSVVAIMVLIGFVLVGYSLHLFLSNWIYSRSIIFQLPEAGKTHVIPSAVPLLSL